LIIEDEDDVDGRPEAIAALYRRRRTLLSEMMS